jgi:hypothetical protein
MSCPEKNEWKNAMDREMDSIRTAGTYLIKPIPDSKSAVRNRWVYTKKYDKYGQVKRYKARLVAKGYTQIQGIRDYVRNGLVSFEYCKTSDQLGDMFTKPLPGSVLRNMLTKLGLLRKVES